MLSRFVGKQKALDCMLDELGADAIVKVLDVAARLDADQSLRDRLARLVINHLAVSGYEKHTILRCVAERVSRDLKVEILHVLISHGAARSALMLLDGLSRNFYEWELRTVVSAVIAQKREEEVRTLLRWIREREAEHDGHLPTLREFMSMLEVVQAMERVTAT